MNWEYLIDESALAKLLPATYAHFARPVRDSLVLFLNGLSKSRQNQILAEQSALPVATTVSERLGLLARSCPVLHKLGQVLARDQRLAPELRHQLQQLESLPPTVDLGTIHAILADELGPLKQLGITLLPPAIAEASVAVVIPYRDDRNPAARDGVFKILKPGIAERMAEELELLGLVGTHLDGSCDELSLPHLDYRETFDHIRSKLGVEILLDQEQLHLSEATSIFKDEPEVQIPTLYAHCTPRVTAMERIFGAKVTDPSITSLTAKQRLANLIMRALVAQPMFAQSPAALFHSDPHAGNLLYTRDGRLAILDWSLVGHLGDAERIVLGQLALAAITLRSDRIVGLLEQLDVRRNADRTGLTRVVERSLRQIRRGAIPGLTWLLGMLDDATQNARLRAAADLLLFRKSLHSLEGVIGELGGDSFSSDKLLICEFIRHFGCEWPSRWLSTLSSHKFATRLSNLDLAEALWSCPLTAARFWQAELMDRVQYRQALAEY